MKHSVLSSTLGLFFKAVLPLLAALIFNITEGKGQVFGGCEIVYCFGSEGGAPQVPIWAGENFQYFSTIGQTLNPSLAVGGCITITAPAGSGPLHSIDFAVGGVGVNVPVGSEKEVNFGNGVCARIKVEDDPNSIGCRYLVTITYIPCSCEFCFSFSEGCFNPTFDLSVTAVLQPPGGPSYTAGPFYGIAILDHVNCSPFPYPINEFIGVNVGSIFIPLGGTQRIRSGNRCANITVSKTSPPEPCRILINVQCITCVD